MTGIEPAHGGFTIHYLDPLGYIRPHNFLRIEPTSVTVIHSIQKISIPKPYILSYIFNLQNSKGLLLAKTPCTPCYWYKCNLLYSNSGTNINGSTWNAEASAVQKRNGKAVAIGSGPIQ
jgi:hypothetical protein